MADVKRILVADDSETITTILATALRGSGYEVTTATSGSEAYELGCRSVFDLVIMDQLMPGLLGIEVIERWQQEGIEYDVLVLSGVDDDRVASDWVEIGAADIVSKPFDLPRLLELIKKRLDA